jgi:putative nucleotidyltransferase with HDIG domain
MRADPSVLEAESVAEGLLAPLRSRWRHTQAVAARAAELVHSVPAEDRDLLVVAAWWHDLGYAPEIRVTGMHQIDGARYLTDLGYSPRLCALVAHHSAATCEAGGECCPPMSRSGPGIRWRCCSRSTPRRSTSRTSEPAAG